MYLLLFLLFLFVVSVNGSPCYELVAPGYHCNALASGQQTSFTTYSPQECFDACINNNPFTWGTANSFHWRANTCWCNLNDCGPSQQGGGGTSSYSGYRILYELSGAECIAVKMLDDIEPAGCYNLTYVGTRAFMECKQECCGFDAFAHRTSDNDCKCYSKDPRGVICDEYGSQSEGLGYDLYIYDNEHCPGNKTAVCEAEEAVAVDIMQNPYPRRLWPSWITFFHLPCTDPFIPYKVTFAGYQSGSLSNNIFPRPGYADCSDYCKGYYQDEWCDYYSTDPNFDCFVAECYFDGGDCTCYHETDSRIALSRS